MKSITTVSFIIVLFIVKNIYHIKNCFTYSYEMELKNATWIYLICKYKELFYLQHYIRQKERDFLYNVLQPHSSCFTEFLLLHYVLHCPCDWMRKKQNLDVSWLPSRPFKYITAQTTIYILNMRCVWNNLTAIKRKL
jgi:hypothetical protein